jgi:hypothetical protein
MRYASKSHELTASAHLPRDQVHLDVACAQRGPWGMSSGAELGPDTSRQLGQRERLGEVIDCARVKPRHTVLYLPQRGQDDDRQSGLGFLHAGEHLEPALSRQHQIEHHEVDVVIHRSGGAGPPVHG